MISPDRHARIERRPAGPGRRSACRARTSRMRSDRRSAGPRPARRRGRRVGRIRLSTARPSVDLAAARFADHAQRLAGLQIEADAVDGLHDAPPCGAKSQPPPTWKCTFRSRTESSGALTHELPPGGMPSSVPGAIRRAAAARSSAGSASNAHRTQRSLEGAARRQALQVRRLAGDGRERVAAVSSSRGIERSSPVV